MISSPIKFAGRDWFHDFSIMKEYFEEKDISRYAQRLEQKAAVITKSWNRHLNTEWLIRHYLSLKMIFSASVMLTSHEFAIDKNITIVDGYLQYYSLLSCMRAVMFSNLQQKWNDGELIDSSHTKTINIASDTISLISKKTASTYKEYANELKSMREIYSYGAPSSGPALLDKISSIKSEKTVSYCSLLAEIAQMNSEIIEKSIDKHYIGEFALTKENVERCFVYTNGDASVLDKEDAYRFGYYYRKYPRPTNILCMVSEGHVEDYFGAWCDPDEKEDAYNPDDNWRVIFPFP